MTNEEIVAKAEQLAALASTKAAHMAAAGVAHDDLNATVLRHHHELIAARGKANQASNDHEAACTAQRTLSELKRQHPALLAEVVQ